MKILVTKMPQEPKDCLFSEFVGLRGGFYVCTLKEYIPEASRYEGCKPKCVCRGSNMCNRLEVLNK